MLKVNVHYAKTHLSRLLREVEKGKTVVILRGETPVARLVAMEPASGDRPKVGEPTSSPIRWSKDAFRPMTDDELKEWGL